MSGRRGVHHSGGLKAKRRWLKWRRYQRRCDALAGWEYSGLIGFCRHPRMRGMVMAYGGWAEKGRYAPIGIRDVRP